MHSLVHPVTRTFTQANPGYRLAVIGLISVLISLVAWHPALAHEWLVLAGLIPVLWARASNRLEAAFAVAPYFLYATRDVPDLLQNFTKLSAALCFLVTLLYCALITILWGLAWQTSFAKRVVGLATIAMVTLVPPFGSLFVANPLLASGLLFPGAGLLGIVFLITTWIAIDAWQQPHLRTRVALVGSFFLVWVCLATQLMQTPTLSSTRVVPINTQMSQYPSRKDVQGRYARQLDLIELIDKFSIEHPDNTIFVLPESIAGRQEPRFEWLWVDVAKRLKLRSQSLIYGIETVNAKGLANSALMIGKQSGQASSNTPVPVGSWQPWNTELHYPARLLSADSLQVGKADTHVFFCWEELVPWPWLVASLRAPRTEAAIVMVNHWFGTGTNANDAQERSSKAWAGLFGLRIVRSVNQSPL